MPRKPHISKRLDELPATSEQHLLVGKCLLWGCVVCSGNQSRSAACGKAPYTIEDHAPEIWKRHRDRLLAIWNDKGPRPTGKTSGFGGERYRGAGRLGLPAWGEIFFDGATLPKFDRTWPPDVRKVWRDLKDALK